MEIKRPLIGRWAVKGCCFLGLWGCAWSCGAAGIKGVGGSHGGVLPGPGALLPPGLGKKAAGIVAHAGGSKAGTLAQNKGTTTVATGINAFVSPASSTPGTGVASDGSLGSGVVSYGNSTYSIPASVGMQVGGNLFESFSQFNLLQGEVADFQGPSSVENILARVTGGRASSIDGTIESDIQGANLFLINPSGVMFGPDASLNVSGAFTVSTADYVKLADGGQFNASLGADDVLTAAAVSEFGFVSSTPAAISFGGSQLAVPTGMGLNVIAGNVTLDSATGDTTTPGAMLRAPSGNLTIFSVASDGALPFSLSATGAGYSAASFTTLGAVSLSDGSSIEIDSAQGGGQLVIRSGPLTVTRFSTISSINAGANAGGSIKLTASALSVTDGGEIEAQAAGNGRAGNLEVDAASMDIDGSAVPDYFTGISGESESGANGNGSNMIVTVKGLLQVLGNGEIAASTFSTGNGGNLTVNAGTMDIDGAATSGDEATGIYDQSDQGDAADGGGHGGTLKVNVGQLLKIQGGAQIDTSTFTTGNAGDLTVKAGKLRILGDPNNETYIGSQTDDGGNAGGVTVSAGNLVIDGKGCQTLTGILALTNEGNGDAGNISVNVTNGTGGLLISTGGKIASATFDGGNGGDVQVLAETIVVDGNYEHTPTGIFAQAQIGSTGNAGDMLVLARSGAGTIRLTNGGQFDGSTFGSGAGGAVMISSDLLSIEGFDASLGAESEIGSDVQSGASGNGGNVIINVTQGAGEINIGDAGNISADTRGSGDCGDMTITADQLVINGGNFPISAGITCSVQPGGTGKGGNALINVTQGVGSIDLIAGGQISSESFGSGNSGTLTVKANSIMANGENSVAINGSITGILASAGSEVTGNQTTGSGGSLIVNVTGGAGTISLLNGAQINAGAFAKGRGGSISVHANTLIIDGQGFGDATGIFADAEPGAGGASGNIVLDVTGGTGLVEILNAGEIQAGTFSTGNAGNISLTTNSLIVQGVDFGYSSGIFDEAEPGSSGNGGRINIRSESISFEDGGVIDATTGGSGSGGAITIQGNSLDINGGGVNAKTGIFAQAANGSTGSGGDATVDITNGPGAVNMENAAQITASTMGAGKGGSVTLNTDELVMRNDSSITAQSNGPSSAGSVFINASDAISLSGGSQISTSSSVSNAGSLIVNAGVRISLYGGSIIAASAGDNGGDITVEAGTLLHLDNSSITAEAGTFGNRRSNGSGGNGGDITLDPTFVVLNDSLINANAAIGGGGNIDILSDYFLNSGSQLTATGAQQGNIVIASPVLDLSGALVGLPVAPVGAETQLQETCAMAINGDFSSFLAVGQGDVEAGPDEAQGGTGDAGEGRRKRGRLRKPAHRSGNGS
jgi:filamentous hemagglutinin family protein